MLNEDLAAWATESTMANSSAKHEVGQHKGQAAFLAVYFLYGTWQIFVYKQKKKSGKKMFVWSHYCSSSDPMHEGLQLPQVKGRTL